jgi:putative glutathione S-transferase
MRKLGLLIDGKWSQEASDARNEQGRYKRRDSVFRNWITANGAPGPSGAGGFVAAPGRYHLYISHACPWAHRTMIMRALKGLEDQIDYSVVNWLMAENGWNFANGPGVIPDPLNNAQYMYQVYQAADPKANTRATVPVLWDKQQGAIVSNESSEIIRMFNGAFDGVGAKEGDYYPHELRTEIDTVNERIYHTLNNGVYRCGFATTQEAYDEAVGTLFDTLDWLEERLGQGRYLFGDRLSEADIRLFPTLIRFDVVYAGHFKCNKRRIVDYPNLWGYTRDLYQRPAIGKTVNFQHIKNHYYMSHPHVNPSRIVPAGPVVDFNQPHDRAVRFAR